MGVVNSGRIDAETRAAVAELVRRAAAVDGVAPLSEQGLLNLRHEPDASATDACPAGGGVQHLVIPVSDAPGGTVGYAQLDARPGGEASAELVVDPDRRRRGHGGELLDAVLSARPDARVWSHGLLPGAAELAASRGLTAVRELRKLGRPLRPDDAFPTELPQGYRLTTYDPARAGDATDWLAVNAAAFADHAEQGRMTRADLRDREAEPWFDPAGFFLVRDPDGRLAAFHWTKVAGGGGEVYVVGVSPRHQGLGLGRAVTAIGLAHLRDAGLDRVELYVDGDNAAALATYEAQGFRTLSRDVQFAARVSR